ncbi:xyloglucan endotransglucosylase/hydrolase protein 2 [Phtheirospermum japonicum]|uniref:Xyloglucan endotransglucosylase/hydrolase protein 2 n=1 Tax=Phtheirospermum japonicum TaxID=374723 RepID=A0A830D7K8_9LAMI|nr:xyloglucan endotransglucosylase/hydrolase protein 2 [Phtheirospermum japonicum]
MDKTPIRVFKNNLASGIAYPTEPMHIEASIWNSDRAGVVDWTQAPFVAQYTGFEFYACPITNGGFSSCASTKYFWNRTGYLELNPQQEKSNPYLLLYYIIGDLHVSPTIVFCFFNFFCLFF